MTTPLKTDWLF